MTWHCLNLHAAHVSISFGSGFSHRHLCIKCDSDIQVFFILRNILPLFWQLGKGWLEKLWRVFFKYCKTQNSGLRSKEEKPRDPINQPSRRNTQEGLLSVAQTGWLWSPGRHSTPNSKLGKLFIDKKPHYQHITYGLQSDWLHVCKAILLAQTSRAFVQT